MSEKNEAYHRWMDNHPAVLARQVAERAQDEEETRLSDAHDTLARFGAAMLKAMHAAAGHDLSASLVEAAALDAGVLVVIQATEPCGSECVCARLTTFPQECLTGPPEILAAIVAMEMEYP